MTASSTSTPTAGDVLVLTADVFFAMRIRTILANLGRRMVMVGTEPDAVAAATDTTGLALIDFNAARDWDALAPLLQSTIPAIGFSSHTNIDGFRAAKAAGITRTVSNGELSRSLPELLERYARL